MANEGTEGKPNFEVANFKTRRHPRFSLNLPINYWRSYNSDGRFSHTIDVSEGGLMVYLPERMEIGRLLRLKLFYSPSFYKLTTVEALAQVLWRNTQVDKDGYFRTGVKFVDISPVDLDRLKSFLKDLDLAAP